MHLSDEQKRILLSECNFAASRSSGPGGQNVNKVNTKVELRFAIGESRVLTTDQKIQVELALKNRINQHNELLLTSESQRSQWQNKANVCEHFFRLIEQALTPKRKRIGTKPTKASKLKRLQGKKLQALKKQLRRKPE